MPFISWDNSLAIGHDLIDSQHKGLFDLINRLFDVQQSGAGGQSVLEVLIDLYRYTATHFTEEEWLMARARCTDLARHKAEHDGFVRQLDALASRAKAGEEGVPLETMGWLVEWLVEHITVMDKRLSGCLEHPS